MFQIIFVVCMIGCVTDSVLGLSPPYKCHSTYYTDPKCIDHPDGYGCECGPGFHWNTYMCMSSAIDSRFEFKAVDPPRYTLLLNKAFPKLKDFTISFWINVSNPVLPGTILSYSHSTENLVRMMSGPTLRFEVFNRMKDTNIKLIPHQWYHVTWTWTSTDGRWVFYINGDQRQSGYLNRTLKPIPSGGQVVLGQSQPFEIATALDGDLSHLNIWNYAMEKEEVRNITKSCNFMYCGNAVQWVEFRSGTRGAMKIRWPSGIFTDQCFTEKTAAISCDTFCSDLIGAQCNEEIKENIKWNRTKAEMNISVDCPRQGDNSTGHAVRVCKLRENANDGIWAEPLIDGCISDRLLEIKNKFRSIGQDDMNEIMILQLADELLNHTENNSYTNPIDIATVIDLLQIMVKTQGVAPKTITWQDGGIKFASAKEVYPTFEQTKTFSQILGTIIDNLLSSKNDAGWNATQPAGVEGDNLLVVMHLFADVISRSLVYHVIDGLVSYKDAVITVFKENIEFKIETYWIEEFYGSSFPSPEDQKHYKLDKNNGFLRIRRGVLMSQNASELPVFIGVSSFRYRKLAQNVPNKVWKGRKEEDLVNTPIMAVYLHIGDFAVNNLSSPILVDLPIIDTFNISNPECVRVVHKQRSNEWYWSKLGCRLLYFDGKSGTCACHIPGVFSITTDMYDVNWDKGDKRPHLMNFASYIGCAVSATFCLMTFIVHVYLRTSSASAALHKNLSLSISCSQVIFMFGIDRYDQPAVCQVFAVLLHFFFLSNYAWLMNEAFNLYIVITYSAHNQTDLNDSGSMLRYHILGWVIPGILVGAFIGTNSDTYYAEDMCWISWAHFWLFIGPAVGIIAVSTLVLIFTAKEHNENSYTKSEKTNKIIMIHMKGLWTQIILVTVCWAFAFISIKMVDQILKYIYALFNCLQGAFFMVFYLLLHEEIREVFKSQKKKQTLVLQGYDFPDEHSLDSSVSSCLLDKDKDSRKKSHYLRSLKKRTNNEDDKGSDCEMITSV
ncbi:cadherin EGF LAG seven-pass G-type receptor 1 [Patella vulgata]|uniref:cadherin EGF LAG seven-pass G-type receptor 1 n=1 Tax=Patella vulgata TaxID=6465 RepID=UPI0024A7D9D6|nr:cadherin EGF LAG seven-pass G-type receptor 1 [Patella vulgata]